MLTGEPLKNFAIQAIKVCDATKSLSKKVNSLFLVEVISSLNGWSSLWDEANNPLLLQRLNAHDFEGAQWDIVQPSQTVALSCVRRLNGVKQEFMMDDILWQMPEAKVLCGFYEYFSGFLHTWMVLGVRKKDTIEEKKIFGLCALMECVFEVARRGINIKRFKGLGEMLPEQLWETTLNPDARTLLQVQLTHLEEAEKIFSTLMGDVVEPRREFIQTNALKVVNLDA
jgi:DNA gyrase subunit B